MTNSGKRELFLQMRKREMKSSVGEREFFLHSSAPITSFPKLFFLCISRFFDYTAEKVFYLRGAPFHPPPLDENIYELVSVRWARWVDIVIGKRATQVSV
jgi:hypothetical protein